MENYKNESARHLVSSLERILARARMESAWLSPETRRSILCLVSRIEDEALGRESRENVSEEDDKAIKALAGAGLGDKYITSRLGFCRDTVRTRK